MLICPKCGKKLVKKEKIFACAGSHIFHIQSVPILLAEKTEQKTREMHEQDEKSEEYSSQRESYLFSLHVNARWNEKILSRLDKPPKKALDAGCGTGMLMSAVQKKFPKADMYAFDLSPEMAAKANLKNTGRVLCADIESMPFRKASFDMAACRGVLHHLPDEKKALSELRRILQKGGRLVISDTSNANPVLRFVRSHIRKHKGFKPEELSKNIKSSGFRIDHTDYFGFLTFPFALPDLFPLFRKSNQEWLIRFLSWADKKIENSRHLQKLCFHMIYTCTAV